MSNDLVSIIIPVYGVEHYLAECVDSVLAQTHRDLEVILVDDGSPDGCPAICDKYAAMDRRVKVIHKENGGAAGARNVGLDAATGDYICLVDSDDYVSEQYVKQLLDALMQNNADAAVCSFSFLYKNGEELNAMRYPENQCMSQIAYLERFLTDWTSGITWNKIFKAEVLRSVRYEEGHKIDDEFFTYQAIMNCRNVVMFDRSLYFYRMRASSVMSSASQYYERILGDKLEYLEIRFLKVSERYPELKLKYLANLADNLIRLRREGGKYPEFLRRIKSKMRRYLMKILVSQIDLRLKYSYLRTVLLPDPHSFSEPKAPDRKSDMQFFD